jgi:hypothetical protein
MSQTAVNVTGDLVASLLIDRFALGRSAEEQLAAEQVREEERAASGTDAIYRRKPQRGTRGCNRDAPLTHS